MDSVDVDLWVIKPCGVDLYVDTNDSEKHTASIFRAEVHKALQPRRPTSTASPP
jgi:hypothetical protein